MTDKEQALAIKLGVNVKARGDFYRLRAELREVAGVLEFEQDVACGPSPKCCKGRLLKIRTGCRHYYESGCSGYTVGACCACLCGEGGG